MRLSKTASLAEIFSSKSFANVTETSRNLSRLEALLSLYLDRNLRTGCGIASFQDGNLVLVTPFAATASHLRYLSRIIIQQLSQHPEFAGLKQLRVVVHGAPTPRAPLSSKPALKLSAEAAAVLRATAENLNDPEISGALERLARLAKPASAE